MPTKITTRSRLTLGNLMPVDAEEIVLHPIEGDERFYVRMKPCVTAAMRDRFNQTMELGYLVMSEPGEAIQQLGCRIIPGANGPMALARLSWMNTVTSYAFPDSAGNPVVRHFDTTPDVRSKDFDDIFGRSNAVAEWFAECSVKVHRLGPDDDERVAVEAGNSPHGATPAPKDCPPRTDLSQDNAA